MFDFKEQTNSLMVRVIPIYLAAELLCLNPFWEGKDQCEPGPGGAAEGSRLHLSCEAGRGVRCEVYLTGARLNSSESGGGLYETALNIHCLCHKAT